MERPLLKSNKLCPVLIQDLHVNDVGNTMSVNFKSAF